MATTDQQSTMMSSLVQRDGSTIWHPYTQVETAPPPIPVVWAEGALLYESDGTAWIDAISSWWVILHGHSHPYILDRLKTQLGLLQQVIFADCTHEPAVALAERLLRLLPNNLTRIFYSDNGSTAVEAALKICLQYWHNRESSRPRSKVITLRHGFHGETAGAMSMSGNGFTDPFSPLLFPVLTVDPPAVGEEAYSVQQMRQHLANNDCACFIFEPVFQAVGGMRSYSKSGLEQLIRLCRQHGVITIADEVVTGLGRTGPLFVSETLTETPDIVCLAKGLSGGYIPLGVTAAAEFLFDGFRSPHRIHALQHGHSTCGNALACTAADACLTLLEEPVCERQRRHIERQHRDFQAKLAGHPKVARCIVQGTILALDYQTGEASSYYHSKRDLLARFFREEKVLLRPFGNCVSVVPPYVISEEQLQRIYAVIESSLEII